MHAIGAGAVAGLAVPQGKAARSRVARPARGTVMAWRRARTKTLANRIAESPKYQ